MVSRSSARSAASGCRVSSLVGDCASRRGPPRRGARGGSRQHLSRSTRVRGRTTGGAVRVNTTTNSTTKPLSVIYPIALESSYAGKNIYVLTITSAGQPNKQALIFHNSTDEGNTFITDTIIIKQGNINFQKVIVDHKENIYILLDDKILATFDLGNTWMDITPKDAGLQSVTDISISFDNYIYISTRGLGILRTVLPNSENARFIKVKATRDENFDCVSDTGGQLFGLCGLHRGLRIALFF